MVRATAAALTLLLLGTTGAAYAALPHGVDTSHYQHGARLRWEAVKASGVKFAFLKATEGSTYTDPKFATDWAATRRVGIYHGAYHFARPSFGSARRQARHFARVIGPQRVRGTLPPVLDLEATGGLRPRPLITWTRAWLTKVTQLTGRHPIIYTSPLFWRDHLHNSAGFHAYPLWVAHYGVRAPLIPGHWPTWSFWQSTSAARITGISGRTDRDVFNGSLTQLQKFALAFRPSHTSLTLAVSNPAPMTGQRVAFKGTLTDTAGRPVRNRPVTLLRRQPGSSTWTKVGSVRTGHHGFYRLRTVVVAAGSGRTTYAGEADFRPSASTVTRVALTPAPTVLSLDPVPDQAYAGSAATMTGSLHRSGGAPLAGQPVTLSRRVAGKKAWRVLARLTTDGTGAFRTTVQLMTTASYRADYAANPTYAGSTSPVTKNPCCSTPPACPSVWPTRRRSRSTMCGCGHPGQRHGPGRAAHRHPEPARPRRHAVGDGGVGHHGRVRALRGQAGRRPGRRVPGGVRRRRPVRHEQRLAGRGIDHAAGAHHARAEPSLGAGAGDPPGAVDARVRPAAYVAGRADRGTHRAAVEACRRHPELVPRRPDRHGGSARHLAPDRATHAVVLVPGGLRRRHPVRVEPQRPDTGERHGSPGGVAAGRSPDATVSAVPFRVRARYATTATSAREGCSWARFFLCP